MNALQLMAILPPETIAEFRLGAGRVCTVTSSRPNAPGVLLKSNSSVPLVPAEETMYCMFVQPNTGRSVAIKSVEPFHLATKPFGAVSPWLSATLVNQNETSNFWPAIVGTVCDNVPLSGHWRSEEHTSELQSLRHLVCRLLLEKKKK